MMQTVTVWERVSTDISRTPVPGGWLYRTNLVVWEEATYVTRGQFKAKDISITFVPWTNG